MDSKLRRRLVELAAKYETPRFLEGDPSWFMHQAVGAANQEATAFVASCLSFGSRSQFMARIEDIVRAAKGDVDRWVRTGGFEKTFAPGDGRCFYRFFTHGAMNEFLCAYRRIMEEHGSLGAFVRGAAKGDARAAVGAMCAKFAALGSGGVVPCGACSACKRICMFLRWMARDGSPVDLGLWSGFLDKGTLVVPLDTHVVQEACRLGLLNGRNASMAAAVRLTAALAKAFPGDPCRGDFALFGLGVDSAP